MAKVSKTTPWQIISYVLLGIVAVIVVIPFLWMIITSLQPDTAHVLKKPISLPWPPAFSN